MKEKVLEFIGRAILGLFGLFLILMSFGVTMPLHDGYKVSTMVSFAIYMGMSALMMMGFYVVYKAWLENKVVAVETETQGLDPKNTQFIVLDNEEREWIKFCKGHYNEKYPINATDWITSIKPFFAEKYAWSPDEHYRDYLNCLFLKLFDVYIKIRNDRSGHNADLHDVFNQAFDERSIRRNYKLANERAIAELCGLIQCNTVIENGVERYKL